jgi:hypothetical protein
MSSPLPSSVKSEPAGPLYSVYGSNYSYTSIDDTSLESTLTIEANPILPVSSSIPIDAQVSPSDETSYDRYQGFSAPTRPVYINMGVNDQQDDVRFAPTTPDPPLSQSIGTVYVDRSSPQPTTQRQSHHHHHHPHHSQTRNRYPYLQRPISTKKLDGVPSRNSLDNLPHYEHRPAFRRSYYALRKQRIPKGIEKKLTKHFI